MLLEEIFEPTMINDIKNKFETLYVCRPLLNAEELIVWAKSNGFEKLVEPDAMHVTIIFSKTEVKWSDAGKPKNNMFVTENVTGRKIRTLGDKGAVVLEFKSKILTDRFNHFIDSGAKSDYPEYLSHVTLTYEGADLDLTKISPFSYKLMFGPEIWQPIDLNFTDKIKHI